MSNPPSRTKTQGDVVVITGASSGIGRATAHAFARKGARLVLAARSEGSLGDVAEECRERGGTAIVVPTDVSDERQVEALAQAAVAAFGRIDVWVGCASVFSYGRFDQTPPDVFRKIVETNLFGSVNGARAVLPRFRERGAGTLIFVGSLYSKVTTPYVSPYVTSKFGLLGFSEVLREELRDATGIDLCVVLPATIDTPIYQHAANYTGQRVHPLPPVAGPERVARVIVGLAERPRPVVVVGQLQRFLIPLHAALPRLYEAGIVPIMNLLALRPGSVPASDGTVFEPSPATNRIDGGWRSRGWRLLAAVVLAGVAAASVARARVKERGPR